MYKMVKRMFTSFLTGVIAILPLSIFGIICWKLSEWFLSCILKKSETDLPTVLLISIVIVVVTFVIGFLAKSYLLEKFIDLCNLIIFKIPGLNKIFIGIQQVIGILRKSEKPLFSEAVVVEYPKKDCYSIGFVTSRETDEISSAVGKTLVSVFIPSTPNPASGSIIFLPEAELIKVDLDSEIAMQAIISGGVVSSSMVSTDNACSHQASKGVIQGWRRRKSLHRMFFDPRD